MPGFNWKHLKDGFRGFESLAYRYVEATFPNQDTWKSTPETRDGNRDAYTIVRKPYTIILGFRPYPAKEEQWWMEAKYSEKKKLLTRYRLDATIVSAVLAGNVSKIIFVTNIQVAAKTVMDIRQALKRAASCRDVVFCSKNTLELWLHNNPDIREEFFHDFESYNYVPPELLITEEVEFYAHVSQRMSFREPVVLLNPNSYYSCHFTAFSNSDQTFDFRPSDTSNNMVEYCPKRFELKPGDNQLQFSFRFSPQINVTDWQPKFVLGPCEVLSKKHIEISNNLNIKIEISSQKDISDDFRRKMDIFRKSSIPTIYCITGNSGTGKTHLLSCIMDEWPSDNKNFFHQEFSSSTPDNNIMLVEMVLFILFPFVSPKDIDLEYLEAIQHDNYISVAVRNLVAHKESFEEMGRALFSFSSEEDLFPVSTRISPRFIILDDIQKLNYAGKNFLLKLINNVKRKNIPIFFVLSGQPAFFTDEYVDYKKYWTVYEMKCELRERDIIKYLEDSRLIRHVGNLTSFKKPFQTVMELFIFAKHLAIMGNEIRSFQEFLFACRQFYLDKISEQYLLDMFYKIDKHHPELSEFINAVYWAENGIHCNLSDLSIIDKSGMLLKEGLTEYREGTVVPVHDIYVHIYRKHYKPLDKNKYFQTSDLQALRLSMLPTYKSVNWPEIVDIITNLKQDQKHHTIMYILEDTFENMELTEVCQWMGKDTFYTLYMIYAQVATHLSTKLRSGRFLFEKIRDETSESTSLSLSDVNETAFWEVLNSSYEWLEYKESEILIKDLLRLISKFQRYGKRPPNLFECIRYHDAMVIQTLIDSDMDKIGVHDEFLLRLKKMLENNFVYRAESFQVRYALTLLQRSPGLALELLQKSMYSLSENYGKDDKYYLWSAMAFYFLQMIYKKQFSAIDQTIVLHEKMKKDFFNDYRKKILALASFHYSQGELSDGNKYLFSDVHIERPLRPRQKGFYYSTIALHESVSGNYIEAISALEVSADIFSHLPDYLKIINHNLSLLKERGSDVQKFEFSFEKHMDENTFYIDPRCIW